MTRELTLNLEGKNKTAYRQLADAVRTAIQNGQLRKGEKLPSTRSLSRTVKMHRHTVRAAMAELVAEGWLTARLRQAYKVNENLPSHFFEAMKQPWKPATKLEHAWRIVRSSGTSGSTGAAGAAKYAFKSGVADLRLFPYQEFKSHINDTMKRSRPGAFAYGDPAGHPPLVEAIKTYLRRVRAISGREIVVTNGSQEGIFLAAQLLVKHGDMVAVERLGYQPAWEALRAAGGKLVPIDIDEEGMDPDSLAKILRRHNIRLIYTTPLHQYPTTVTLPISRRLRLYELAARAGVPILEDDYDHEFHYRSQPLAPLASRDTEGLVIYVSTFSKVLFPSARIGFLAVPKKLAPLLADYRRIISRQNTGLIQDVVARWMNAGGFERHLRKMRRAYEERLAVLNDCLEEGKADGMTLSWSIPDGGMAVWVDTNRDAERVAKLALGNSVFVHPETDFQMKPPHGHHLRLGFANQSPEEIRQGMALLFKTLKR